MDKVKQRFGQLRVFASPGIILSPLTKFYLGVVLNNFGPRHLSLVIEAEYDYMMSYYLPPFDQRVAFAALPPNLAQLCWATAKNITAAGLKKGQIGQFNLLADALAKECSLAIYFSAVGAFCFVLTSKKFGLKLSICPAEIPEFLIDVEKMPANFFYSASRYSC